VFCFVFLKEKVLSFDKKKKERSKQNEMKESTIGKSKCQKKRDLFQLIKAKCDASYNYSKIGLKYRKQEKRLKI